MVREWFSFISIHYERLAANSINNRINLAVGASISRGVAAKVKKLDAITSYKPWLQLLGAVNCAKPCSSPTTLLLSVT